MRIANFDSSLYELTFLAPHLAELNSLLYLKRLSITTYAGNGQ